MYNHIIAYLKTYLKTYSKRTTIKLNELIENAPQGYEREDLAKAVKRIMANNILIAKNIKNNDGRKDPLPLRFTINKNELKKDYIRKIQEYKSKLSNELDLEPFYDEAEEEFDKALPYINKVNEYIISNGLPKETATSQERSFHITGDEKWIDENGGKSVLTKIKIYDKLKIHNGSDPLMLAVNVLAFDKPQHYHLIVENKATFIALLEVLSETEFCSLIFGSGWKIVGNINMLEKQTGLKENNVVYYFGDIDNEGLAIYNSLSEKVSVKLATEFYRALLKTDCKEGKKNQKKKPSALKNFSKHFDLEEQKLILEKLDTGYYWPQEGLNRTELQHIWRNSTWK
ncbi:DUF2399 domain-containing protein [Clostridium sp. YIM B02505]|uniref:DUF2399 domain-containing protein n=1 Tax=Clostridium yunnanense TaxID=2800325 RepID=A0ABS1EUX0_9CLOT|nr:Wadjet anti-phage system protein JetD domain-containing protein [Clostridium yunnanense]MBK1813186.1 DUF2399 domain-containing protein [Clostridium yunnanense]